MATEPDLHAVATAAPPAKPPMWNDPACRAMFFQVLVVGFVIMVAVFLVRNTITNLERQGIASGFGFLGTTAGFSIGETLIPYHEEHTYGRTFLVGVLNTVWISFWGILLASILGFILGVARLSSNWLISKISMVYIEVLRNIPLLLQMFFWYFAVLRPLPGPRQSLSLGDGLFLNNRGLHFPSPVLEENSYLVLAALVATVAVFYVVGYWAARRQDRTGEQFPLFWVGVGLVVGIPSLVFFAAGSPLHFEYPALKGFNFKGGHVMSPEFFALLIALSAYTAAFIGEIVRAGILAVSHGQTEAAYALGLRRTSTLRLVIIPQALRVIIPPLTSQYLNLTKNSSLAAAIAYPDLVLVFAGTALMQTGQAVEIIAMTMAVYLFLSLAISTLMNWYNNKIALVER